MLTNGFIEQAENAKTIEGLLNIKPQHDMTLNKIRYHIVLSEQEVLSRFIDQVSIEDQKSLKDISPVSDITDVEIVDMYIDDHELCTKLIFYDQNGKLRSSEVLWDPYAPGMAIYYQESNRIKDDLITLINHYYQIESEGNNVV